MAREKGTGHKSGRKDSLGRDITEWGKKEPQRAGQLMNTASLLGHTQDAQRVQKKNLDNAFLVHDSKLSDYDLSEYTVDDKFSEYNDGVEMSIYTDDGDVVYEQSYEHNPQSDIVSMIIDPELSDSEEAKELYATIINYDDIYNEYDNAMKDYLESRNDDLFVDVESLELDYQRVHVSTAIDTNSPEYAEMTMDDVWSRVADSDNMFGYRTPDEVSTRVKKSLEGDTQYAKREEAIKGIMDNKFIDHYDYVDNIEGIDDLITKSMVKKMNVYDYVQNIR